MTKVLVIGIDGGTFDLIEPWSKEGHLPNISYLMENGSFGELKSTPLPLTGPSWSSFITGKNPGKHGIYDFVKVTSDYRMTPITSKNIDSDTIFDIISANNKKIISINVPITYPPFKVHGYMVSGMPAFDLRDDITYPKDLASTLPKNYKILPKTVYNGRNEEEILSELYEILDVQSKVVMDFIREDWDIFITVFFVTDVVSHWFWKYYDKSHPLYKKDSGKYKRAILDIYKAVDECIGKMLKKIDRSTYVVVMSDHGFGPLHGDIFINNWLAKKSYLKFKRNPLTQFKLLLHKLGWTMENVYKIIQKLGLANSTVTVSDETRQFLLKFFLSFSDVDWSRTKAFSMANFGPIYINLKGKMKFGAVNPGTEYKTLVDKIKKELYEIKDDNGDNLIEKVYTKEELFNGKHSDEAPDIIYIPKDMKYTANRYFEFASNKLIGKPHRDMSGDHRYNGIFIAAGRGIKRNFRFSGAKIYDIAPTILYLMGLKIPEDMDGRVLSEIFENKIEYNKERKYNSIKRKSSALSECESIEDKIKERLRNLGYIGG